MISQENNPFLGFRYDPNLLLKRRRRGPRALWILLYIFGFVVLAGLILLIFYAWTRSEKNPPIPGHQPTAAQLDFLNETIKKSKRKRQKPKKLYLAFVGDTGSGKTSLIDRWLYGDCSDMEPTAGLGKFAAGWKSESVYIKECQHANKKHRYHLGTREIYDFDASGVAVIVDGSQHFPEILEQARKWRKWVREVVYASKPKDGQSEVTRLNIPLYLVLTKFDLQDLGRSCRSERRQAEPHACNEYKLSPDSTRQLNELMWEEQVLGEPKVIPNTGAPVRTKGIRGKSGYSGWYLLSTEKEPASKVSETLYGILNKVSDFHGWKPLPPQSEISQDDHDL